MQEKGEQALVLLKHLSKYGGLRPERVQVTTLGSNGPRKDQQQQEEKKKHRKRQVALAAVSKETRTDALEKKKFVSEF